MMKMQNFVKTVGNLYKFMESKFGDMLGLRKKVALEGLDGEMENIFIM